MVRISKFIIAYLALVVKDAYAFQDATKTSTVFDRLRTSSTITGTVMHESQTGIYQDEDLDSRRSFIRRVSLCPIAALPAMTSMAPITQASGGATAGGAYLLSAKKRYYERVKASVSGLLQAADGLKAGDSKVAKEYFSNEADGGWKDLTAAGYLLSNAFRRSSSTAPDSLPAVKVCIGQTMELKLLFFSKYH